jgi:DNA-binding GntR family transcriptional regulator
MPYILHVNAYVHNLARDALHSIVQVTSSLVNIKSSSLREQAARAIRTGIIAGEITPGELYSVPALSARLGVSATPVREAMLDLVSEGLVEPVRNRGYRVVSLSADDLESILRLRLLLEVPSMGDVALQHRKEDLPRFRTLAEQLPANVSAGDVQGYMDGDYAFHLGLLGLLDNSRLVDIVGMLRNQSRLFDVGKLYERGELMASAREHADILAAIERRDREATEKLMHGHLLRTRSAWTVTE